MLFGGRFFIIGALFFACDIYASQNRVTIDDLAKAVEFIMQDNSAYQNKTDRALSEKDKQIEELKAEIISVKELSEAKRIAHIDSPANSLSTEYQSTSILQPTHIVTGYLRVRKEPSIYSAYMYTLNPDEKVIVTSEKNGMAFIGSGWCSSKYLVPVEKDKN